MNMKYNFDILFEKIDEAKQDQSIDNTEVDSFEEINENIRLLSAFITDSEEKIIFTRAS